MLIKVIGITGQKIIDTRKYSETDAKKIIQFYSDHKNYSLEYQGC